MKTTWLYAGVMSAMLLAPSAAQADDSVLGRFTSSMTSVYVTAEMCKDVSSLNAENYAVIIRNYVQYSFKSAAPYWALPNVSARINDRDRCVFSIEQDLVSYHQASRAYATNYPQSPVPPVLTSNMLGHGASSPDEVKEHYLTPSVLVQ